MTRHSPLLLLTLARLRLFVREPGALFWTFGFPILLTIALGIAFRARPPEAVLAGVEDGPGARALAETLAQGDDIKVSVLSPAEARTALRVGRVAIVVVPGEPRVYRYDPTRPESRLARELINDRLQRAAGRQDPVAVEESVVTEPGGRYVDFLLPGLLGLNMMSSGMWGIAYVIVETRVQKLLRRMVATPMRRRHFLLSFVVMRALFLFLELPVLLLFGWLAFDVTVHGSLALLVGIAMLGALTFAGIGLLLASRAQNTQTVSGLINLVMMPMFVGSGVFFSISNFPDAVQPALKLLPLTALNDAMRAVMNEGAGLLAVAPQIALLFATGVVSFAVALKLFRWSRGRSRSDRRWASVRPCGQTLPG